MTQPRSTGELGEVIATRFLASRGARIVGRNVHVGGGEIDIVVEHDGTRIAVEVKTTANGMDPMRAMSDRKQRHLRAAARACGLHRIDVVCVTLEATGVGIRWVPGAV